VEPARPPSVDRLSRQLSDVLPADLRVAIARLAADRSRTDPSIDAARTAEELARRLLATRQQAVINATGVILHTNLGRALLSEEAAIRARQASVGYTNLELDLTDGTRGGRTSYVSALLQALTGAEDALVVNNNAGALFLTLAAMAAGRSVPVSRGELIEIGGSYRLPDLMAATGTKLIEVGTTNRTRLGDYSGAIDETTALLLKVHPSNYRIEGFSEETSLEEIAKLARQHGIPTVFDVGSGLLDERTPWLDGPPPSWLQNEPGVVQSLEHGADLVMFSGDKLLGGPQAGIVVGNRELVAGLRRHPVARAMRVDGPTLAALESTLEAYADRRAADLPLWTMATLTESELTERSRTVADAVPGARVVPGASTIGAGSVPGASLPGSVIEVTGRADAVFDALLASERPILARRESGTLVVDLRTVSPVDDPVVAQALEEACRS
jgi:L-seryl-tRNA(Ser) seleniumtransferase